MPVCQSLPASTLPNLWLLSDARNDNRLEVLLHNLPRGSGFVFRHYHLPDSERHARFAALGRIAHGLGHLVILSDNLQTARCWGADGVYGAPSRWGGRRGGLLRIATAHDMREIAAANHAGADAVMLSPVFPTRSHPGAATLGPLRYRLIARHAHMPVIALGGMNGDNARRLHWSRWAAIDGHCT